MREKIVILGTGPAGLTAGIYAARANLEPLIIDGSQPGGQLTLTSEVENFPGFPSGVQGHELMQMFRDQAQKFGARFEMAEATSVELEGRPFRIVLSSGKIVEAQTLIISTGASAKWLGLESEKRLMAKGVSACATCDGFFFKNQDIVVVGGGDTAMEEATFLTRFAKSVTIVHRRESFRASKIMVQKAMQNPKIRVLFNTAVDEILGDQVVEAVRLRNTLNDQVEMLPVQGVFMAIGHQPNTGLFSGQLDMNPAGYLTVEPGSTRTRIAGVFAAGDVADPIYRQAVTAAGTGCMAAIDAERFLEHEGL